jgi:hypothetical protein
MQKAWIEALSTNRRMIRGQWEAFLRLEQVDSPIADPEHLVYLIDWTFDEILGQLRIGKAKQAGGVRPFASSAVRAGCHCGRNPLIKFFLAGEQALLEALVLLQSGEIPCEPGDRSTAVTELYLAVHTVAAREVDTLCSMCRRPRANASNPRQESYTGAEALQGADEGSMRSRYAEGVSPAMRLNTRLNCERDWNPAS